MGCLQVPAQVQQGDFQAGEARAQLTALDQVFLDQSKEKVQYLGLANTIG